MKVLSTSLLVALSVFASNSSLAELIAVNGQPAVRANDLPRPKRGMSMAAVESQFGAPAQKRAAVGQPPITRWDYPGFSVYFEHEIVLHAVAGA